MPRFPHTGAALALALGLVLLLGACGKDADDPTTSPAQGAHSAADVAFAQQSLTQHVRALRLVEAARERDALSPGFVQLLDEIRSTHEPRIEAMAGWLRAWGEEVPPTEPGASEPDSVGTSADEAISELARTPDAAYEGLWLTLMVIHQEEAVVVADAEAADGTYGPAVDLAEEIISTGRTQIDRMNSMIS